jgi:hypothetical protein
MISSDLEGSEDYVAKDIPVWVFPMVEDSNIQEIMQDVRLLR